MKNIEYNRTDAVNYAKKWALLRNPNYYNFQNLGGDCTNFVSQSIYAGAEVMNLSHNRGWYYYSASNRSASWTSVEYLYEFLVNNQTAGPYAKIVSEQNIEPGDVVQLADSSGDFYHSLVITQTKPLILVCAHTYDALDRPLISYTYHTARFLHIEGVRKW